MIILPQSTSVWSQTVTLVKHGHIWSFLSYLVTFGHIWSRLSHIITHSHLITPVKSGHSCLTCHIWSHPGMGGQREKRSHDGLITVSFPACHSMSKGRFDTLGFTQSWDLFLRMGQYLHWHAGHSTFGLRSQSRSLELISTISFLFFWPLDTTSGKCSWIGDCHATEGPQSWVVMAANATAMSMIWISQRWLQGGLCGLALFLVDLASKVPPWLKCLHRLACLGSQISGRIGIAPCQFIRDGEKPFLKLFMMFRPRAGCYFVDVMFKD